MDTVLDWTDNIAELRDSIRDFDHKLSNCSRIGYLHGTCISDWIAAVGLLAVVTRIKIDDASFSTLVDMVNRIAYPCTVAGIGGSGVVFVQGKDKVVKIFKKFDREGAFAYLEMAQKHTDNPYFPKVYRLESVGSLVYVEQERLHCLQSPLAPDIVNNSQSTTKGMLHWQLADSLEMLPLLRHPSWLWLPIVSSSMSDCKFLAELTTFKRRSKFTETVEKDYQQFRYFLRHLVALANDFEVCLDFQPWNIGWRDDGQLVCFDPVF